MPTRPKNPNSGPSMIDPEPIGPTVETPSVPRLPVSSSFETPTARPEPSGPSNAWTPEAVSRLISLAVLGQVASLALAGFGTLGGFVFGLQSAQREATRTPVALAAPPAPDLEPVESAPQPLRVADRRGGRDETVVRTVAARPSGPTWSVPGVKMGVSTRIHVLGGTMRHDAVFLDNTDIHDGDLEVLQRLPALAWLNLDNTPITDAGLKALEPIKSLRWVSLVGDKAVTPRGIESLKAAIPGIEVHQ